MNYDSFHNYVWFIILTKNNLTSSKTLQSSFEDIMKNRHDDFFEDYLRSFTLNLENIWEESSARELSKIENKKTQNSAIVIGRGPSLKKNYHLEKLAASNYKGSIVCCDGILPDALKAGVTPIKFPKFYVVTIDPFPATENFYRPSIVKKYGSKIKGIFSTVTRPSVVKRARLAGIKIHWLHSLYDLNEGKKSFNNISALMVRTKNHTNGLPAIQTGGNAGTSSWFISWQILKCTTVALIGINHGWELDDSLETILSHTFLNEKSLKKFYNKDGIKKKYQKLFPRIYNPEYKKYCISDPLFQFYRNALIEFIRRSPNNITTINATEGGSIFGKRVICSSLENFLKQYKK